MSKRLGERLLPPLAWVLGGSVVALGLLAAAVGRGSGDPWFQTVAGLLVLAMVAFVGALIAAKLPTNPYGWLWLGIGLAFAGQGLVAARRHVTASDTWLLQVVEGALFVGVLVLLVLVLLLFPTGRLPSPAWRWLPRAAVVVATAALGAALVTPRGDALTGPWSVAGTLGTVLARTVEAGVIALLLLVVAAAASVFARLRRAGPVERQQLKWLALAAGLVAVTIALDWVVPAGPVWALANTVALTMLPVAVGIAVLRYRLYEIDRIVSRTVSYGLLTGCLLGLYLLGVALLRPLLEPLTGSSALAVAGSTLAVAATFHPIRRRLQARVDRRFHRARYDAARAMNAFAARLREQVDLDEVVDGLRSTVTTTVAPTRVAVWLRVPSHRDGA